jgi:hypothetical protein
MNKCMKLFESRKILIGLVVLFFVVSTVQSVFLVRLYHLFDQDVRSISPGNLKTTLALRKIF